MACSFMSQSQQRVLVSVTCHAAWSWETSLCVSGRDRVFSLYLVRRGGGIYVAYITSWPGLDATFIQLMGANKKHTHTKKTEI